MRKMHLAVVVYSFTLHTVIYCMKVALNLPTGEEETDYLPAQHVSQLLQCDDMELRELIQTHHPSLNKFINFTCLIPFFNQYKIFTNDEMYDFQSDKSDQEKTISLINYLQKKDANGVQNFIRSLHGAKEHSGHLVILKEMSSKLTV